MTGEHLSGGSGKIHSEVSFRVVLARDSVQFCVQFFFEFFNCVFFGKRDSAPMIQEDCDIFIGNLSCVCE